MIHVLKKQNGLSIVGQGGKIILFMLPSLIAAIWVHRHFPHIASLPDRLSFIRPVGYVLLLLECNVLHPSRHRVPEANMVYFIVSVFLYVGVMTFIGTEEKQLTQAFGKQYEDYLARVDRLVPLKQP